jgi:hypothetical protein
MLAERKKGGKKKGKERKEGKGIIQFKTTLESTQIHSLSLLVYFN